MATGALLIIPCNLPCVAAALHGGCGRQRAAAGACPVRRATRPLAVATNPSPDKHPPVVPKCSGSVYMHKDRDGPLAAGPAWDYNEAYGLCCGYPIEGWNNQGVSAPGAVPPSGWVGERSEVLVDGRDGRVGVLPGRQVGV